MLFAGDVVVDGGVGRRWVLGVGCQKMLLCILFSKNAGVSENAIILYCRMWVHL
jgi:hypothetical protein